MAGLAWREGCGCGSPSARFDSDDLVVRVRLGPSGWLAVAWRTTSMPSSPPFEHRLSNALVEAVNTRIRLITRRAFDFHSAPPLIAPCSAAATNDRSSRANPPGPRKP